MRHAILLGLISLGAIAFPGCSDDEETSGNNNNDGPDTQTPVTPVDTTPMGPSTTLVCEETGQTFIIQPGQRHCFDPRTINDPPVAQPEPGDGGAGGVGGAGGAGGAPVTAGGAGPEEPTLPPFTGECPVSADVAGQCFQPLCDSEPATTQDNPDQPCCYVGDLLDCSAE